MHACTCMCVSKFDVNMTSDTPLCLYDLCMIDFLTAVMLAVVVIAGMI